MNRPTTDGTATPTSAVTCGSTFGMAVTRVATVVGYGLAVGLLLAGARRPLTP